jgi:peptidoglycan/xylan/chitin deacetylase (PgdA/CDA1 family)
MLNPALVSATPAVFDQQMHHLGSHYHVVSMEDVLNAIEKRKRVPRRSVLLTFDDAYYDFGEVAWPILKQYRLPATLFVPTAYPGQPERRFWWDRLYQAVTYTPQTVLSGTSLGSISLGTPEERRAGLRRLENYVKTISHTEAMALVDQLCDELGDGQADERSVLSWDDLRNLVKEGVTLGAHTRTHPILTQMSTEQVRDEIRGSQQDLRREIENVLPIFSYPGGAHNDAVVKILKEEGFKIAFTTREGQNEPRSVDPWCLRRTNITRRTSLPIFRLRLLQFWGYLDTCRKVGTS